MFNYQYTFGQGNNYELNINIATDANVNNFVRTTASKYYHLILKSAFIVPNGTFLT